MGGNQTKSTINKNIFIFAASTVTGVAISSIIKAAIPQKIGPDEFGKLYFAENIAISLFAFTTLGIDHLIRNSKIASENEIKTIHSEAIFIRFISAIFILITTALLRSEELDKTLLFLLVWQFFFTQNAIFSSILQRNEKIYHVSIANTAAKITLLASFYLLWSSMNSAEEFAVLILSTEVVRTILLAIFLSKNRIWIPFTPKKPTLSTFFKISPFFLQHASQQIYARVGILIIPSLANKTEAAWYGASNNIILLGLIFAPTINAVITPVLSRSKNENEKQDIVNNSSVYILPFLIVISFFFFSFSSIIVTELFGEKYSYSSIPLKILSPTIPITYLSIIYSIDIINQDKVWQLVRTTLVSILISFSAGLAIVYTLTTTQKTGLPSSGAAISTVIAELYVAKKLSSFSTVKIGKEIVTFAFISASISLLLFGSLSTLK